MGRTKMAVLKGFILILLIMKAEAQITTPAPIPTITASPAPATTPPITPTPVPTTTPPITGSTTANTGSTSPFTGSTTANTGSTSPFTGSTTANTGSTSPFTGTTTPFTGNTSAFTGNSTMNSGMTSNMSGMTTTGGSNEVLGETNNLNGLFFNNEVDPQKYIPFWIVILISIGAIGGFFLFVFISFVWIAPRCGCSSKPNASYCPTRAARDSYDPSAAECGPYSSNIEMSGVGVQYGMRAQSD